MARRSPQTFAKRLREHKRDEKNRAKQEKRDQRKNAAADQVEPDGPTVPTASDDDEVDGDGGEARPDQAG